MDRERIDVRLAPAAAAAWAAAWVAPLIEARTAVMLIAALAGTAILVALARHLRWQTVDHRVRRPAWGAMTALAVGAAVLSVAMLNAARAGASIVDELAAERATVAVELRVMSDAAVVRSNTGPAMAEPMLVLDAAVVAVVGRGQDAAASAPVVVLATDEAWADLTPSTVVAVSGRLMPNDRVSRAVAVLRVTRPPEVLASPSVLQQAAARLRAGLRTAVADLPPDARGLLPGLVVGDESLMPPDLLEDAKTTGLTHLSAVSGANVAIVLGVLLTAARWCGLRAWAVPMAGAVGLAGFVILARPDPSVLRATVMGLVVIVALASGAKKRRVAPLCAAVMVLLLIDPWLARSYGFALSVLASAAIVLIVPIWTERWSRWLPAPLAAALAVPVAAQLVCAPVVVMLSDQVSLVAVAANLLAAPAVAPATVLGVVVAATAAVAPAPAAWLAHVAGLPVSWIAMVARWFADRPYAVLDWQGGTGGAATLALVTIVGVLLAPALLRRPHLLAAAVILPALALWGVRAAGPGWPPPGWLVVACDVGQGDALVVSAGPSTAVVVDTGPEPGPVDDCLRHLGITDVAMLLLTHPHADHVGGVLGVIAGRRVASIAVGPAGLTGLEAADVNAAVIDSGAEVVRLAAGWAGVVGSVRLDVLWPSADPAALARLDPAESQENNESLVARVVGPSGTRLLLTGDIEPSAQRALLRSGVDLRAEVLKVPHHGSLHQEAAFLTAVEPAAALISVGADNDYGHPSTVTLDRLRAVGAAVFRTDTGGEIAVAGAPSELEVVSGSAPAVAPAAAPAVGQTVAPALGQASARVVRRDERPAVGQAAVATADVLAVTTGGVVGRKLCVGAAWHAGARWRTPTPPAGAARRVRLPRRESRAPPRASQSVGRTGQPSC